MTARDREYVELLLDELRTVLEVRLLFNQSWNQVQANIDSDEQMNRKILKIKWFDPKDDSKGPEGFVAIEVPIEYIKDELERQKQKLKNDIPDDDTARILYEAVQDYADYDTDEAID